jgi:hypothetical protein
MLADGSVRAAGLNIYGQLGVAGTANRTSFVEVLAPASALVP